jgi:hypothetical protein
MVEEDRPKEKEAYELCMPTSEKYSKAGGNISEISVACESSCCHGGEHEDD